MIANVFQTKVDVTLLLIFEIHIYVYINFIVGYSSLSSQKTLTFWWFSGFGWSDSFDVVLGIGHYTLVFTLGMAYVIYAVTWIGMGNIWLQHLTYMHVCMYTCNNYVYGWRGWCYDDFNNAWKIMHLFAQCAWKKFPNSVIHTSRNHNDEIADASYSWIICPFTCFFFIGSIKLYRHFTSPPYIGMTQVVEILPRVRQWLTYSIQPISRALMSATMIFIVLNRINSVPAR